MLAMADELNALVVFAEHRYFGESLPYGEDSFKNVEKLKYLSSHQALADFAYLITELQT
jgi:lysosomal Pro-X carboxypeptidase